MIMEKIEDGRIVDSILDELEYHTEIDEDGFGSYIIDDSMTYEEFIGYIKTKGCININDVKW